MSDVTDARPLEEQLAHCGGADCKRMAYYRTECACDADWTPAEVYRLRAERDALQARIDGAVKVENFRRYSYGHDCMEISGTDETEVTDGSLYGKRVALVVLEDGK